MLPHDDSAVTVQADGRTEEVSGKALIIVPPGDSTVTATSDSDVVRLFTPNNDNAALARNAASYSQPHPTRRPCLSHGPNLSAGTSFASTATSPTFPATPNRFSRIYRSRSIMVNFSYHYDGPRGSTALSPHNHADFEQISLGVEANSFTTSGLRGA